MATFCDAKGGLLQHKRRPFAMRKAVFCNMVYNLLVFNKLHKSFQSVSFQHDDAAFHVGQTEHVKPYFHKIIAREALSFGLERRFFAGH